MPALKRVLGTMALAAAFGLASGRAVGAGEITDLGVLPGGVFSRGMALSGDGSAVTGSSGATEGERAFVWTAAGGIQSLGVLAGGSFSRGAAITSDGVLVVGTSGSSTGDRGFRWTLGSGLQSMGTLTGGASSSAMGICPDGAFTVGSGSTNLPASSSRAAMWAGAWFDVGALPGETVSVGAAINQFASAVAGWSGTSPRRGMRWTSGLGVQPLGNLAGGTDSFANGISQDGAVVVGGSTVAGVVRAFRWTPAGGMENLGGLTSGGSAEAFGTDINGGAVVGTAMVSGGTSHAFGWTRSRGMVDLNVYLASPAAGSVDLSGWVLTEARAISFDLTAIVGSGLHDGHERAFVIRGIPPLNPPCRADFDSQTGLSVNDIFSFINAWFNQDSRADFNGTDGLSVQDIFDFLGAWFAGCP